MTAIDTNQESGLTTYELIDIFTTLLGNPKHNKALMLWGLTGTGKSQIQRQIAKKLSEREKDWQPPNNESVTGALEIIGSWGLIDLRVSQLEPTDLRGLPDFDTDRVKWKAVDELPFIGQEKRFPEKGILFLDELTHAQPMMQSACYSLVLDRRCGPHVLMPGWKIVAASNYTKERNHTHPMDSSLRNRFSHYHLRCSAEAYKKYCMQKNINPKIIAFLNWNPDYLHKPTQNNEDTYPTPRAWDSVSNSLEYFKNGHLETAIASDIGPGAAAMFRGFLDVYNSPEMQVNIPNILLKKEKSPKLSSKQPNIAWAFASCIAGHVKDKPELTAPAIEYFCSGAWDDVMEIGRTGLSDLKQVLGNELLLKHGASAFDKLQNHPYIQKLSR